MRKKLLRLLRLAPIAIAFWGVASAQVTGTIIGVVTDAQSGKPVAGALIVATSPNLQGEQTAITEADGSYRLNFLPPGDYKLAVQLQGYKPAERSDIVLRVDKTLRANMVVVPEAVQMEEQVVKTGIAPVVNVGSAETGQVVTKEFIASVPVTRNYEGVAVVAPTAQRDLYGISFAGSSSPENNYILDGMNVSDPQYGTLAADIPTNFVEQVDVKVGSFMPEYGRSSAGIVNTVTKSGSNEFHGSIYGNVTPGALSPAQTPVGRAGEAIASFSAPYNGSYDADFGFEVGGPILQDRLWFYAGFQPSMRYDARTYYYRTRRDDGTGAAARDQYNQYIMDELSGTRFTNGRGVNRYYGVAKLTYLFNENHNVALTFNTQPGSNFGRGTGEGGSNSTPSAGYVSYDDNTTSIILRYLGKALDKHLLIEGNLGWVTASNNNQAKTVDGVDIASAPRIQWRTRQRFENFDPAIAALCTSPSISGAATAPGCYVTNYNTGGYGFWQDLTTDRFNGRLAVSGLFEAAGQHQLKGGIDADYAKYSNDRNYTGGVAWRAYGRPLGSPGGAGGARNAFYMYRAYGDQAGTDLNTGLACNPNDINANCDNWTGGANDYHSIAKTNTTSMAYFIQDSWTIANQVTLNFGVRLDTQKMVNDTPGNSPDAPELSINDMWSPRVHAIWDFTGQGRGKVQANWGRYYESIPLDMALRSFGTERQVIGAYELSSCAGTNMVGSFDPKASCPNVYGLAAGQGPGPNTVTLPALDLQPLGGFSYTSASYSPLAPDLKGQYLDQFGGGVEYEVMPDIGVGVEYLGRRLGSVIEDMSSDDGNNYFIANPGSNGSKPWTPTSGAYAGITFNPAYAAAVDPTTGSYITAPFPNPVRRYDAVSVNVRKSLSKGWLGQLSYTYASLRGNYPGLFRFENAQIDPNITSEYDLPTLLQNKYGPLAGNRRHQIKLYGSYAYEVAPGLKLTGGGGFTAFSGMPTNAIASHPAYGDTEAFIIPRGAAGDLDWLFNLDLRGEVEWTFSAPYRLRFSVDVFNVWNAQTVTNVDQNYTLDFVQPIISANCKNKDSITKNDPIAAIQADCPDIRYARTWDDLPATPNLNYGQPSYWQNALAPYQQPIRVRFGLALSF